MEDIDPPTGSNRLSLDSFDLILSCVHVLLSRFCTIAPSCRVPSRADQKEVSNESGMVLFSAELCEMPGPSALIGSSEYVTESKDVVTTFSGSCLEFLVVSAAKNGDDPGRLLIVRQVKLVSDL